MRVGGGFDPPAVAAPPCSGDECQGVVVPSGGEQPAPGSETATGAGNAEPARGAARLKVAQRRVGRAAVVAVRVSVRAEGESLTIRVRDHSHCEDRSPRSIGIVNS